MTPSSNARRSSRAPASTTSRAVARLRPADDRRPHLVQAIELRLPADVVPFDAAIATVRILVEHFGAVVTDVDLVEATDGTIGLTVPAAGARDHI